MKSISDIYPPYESANQVRIPVRDIKDFIRITTKDPGRLGHLQIIGGPTHDNPRWQALSYHFPKDEVRLLSSNGDYIIITDNPNYANFLRRIKHRYNLNYVVFYEPILLKKLNEIGNLSKEEQKRIIEKAKRR
jgi:hypothetical protein